MAFQGDLSCLYQEQLHILSFIAVECCGTHPLQNRAEPQHVGENILQLIEVTEALNLDKVLYANCLICQETMNCLLLTCSKLFKALEWNIGVRLLLNDSLLK